MKTPLLSMIVIGQLSLAAVGEPAPAWAQDAVDTLQQRRILIGDPQGDVHGQRPASRNELAELLERLDQQRLNEEAEFAPASGAAELLREAGNLAEQMTSLETRVDNLEENSSQLQQRRDETRRPGW